MFILVFSFYTFFQRFELLHEKIYSIETKITEVPVKIEFVKRKIDTLKSIINNSIVKQRDELIENENKLSITYSVEEIKLLETEAQDLEFELSLEVARLNNMQEQSDNLLKSLNLLKYIVFVASSIGAGMASLGFTLWYRRVQKLQDKVLFNESQTLSKSNKKEAENDISY